MIFSPLNSKIINKTKKFPFSNLFRKAPQEPIRAELFSIERLEEHAKSLAHAQIVTHKRSRNYAVLGRVKENGRILREAHRNITKMIREERSITPAAEWLVDNFYIVEEQILEIIDDLPPGFYRKLPKLTQGFLKGSPRVYGLAWAFIAHTDSRLDPHWLRRFVQAYQHIDPLSIGEVWAVAISLRIVLVENLRRLVERLTYSKSGQLKADELADALLGVKRKSPVDPKKALRPFMNIPLEKSFAVQLILRLRDQGERVTPVIEWLNQRLEKQNTTAENLVRLEHQEQTAMNTTVRNIITSMRLLSSMDWPQFFEDVSVVDDLFRQESRNFSDMDFLTRDQYRHAIEQLASGSGLSEVEVTRTVIQFANSAKTSKKNAEMAGTTEAERYGDPGYYLISKGRRLFEKQIKCRTTFKLRLSRLCRSYATFFYLGTLLSVTAVLLAIPLYLSHLWGMSLIPLIFFAMIASFPASDLAVSVLNQLVTKSMGPKPLPKLDFSDGIPSSCRTLLVVPTLLNSPQTIKDNLDQLEIHYLSNPKGYLQFALLTDWTDAPQENMPEDVALYKTAREGIQKLNDRHGLGPENSIRFFLFHRKRQWNASEGVWMGWERKRGKLHELNLLLRKKLHTSFIPDSVDQAQLAKEIRYIITLDVDTRMPYGAAYRLAGTISHPLNRPQFNSTSGRVLEGYGIIQPRLTPTLPNTSEGSLFQSIYSGPAGIDPYAFTVSDVYQDLFAEGSYVGKGIYDLDAFEAALADKVPMNTILSHDLFEGLHARAALATDIELFEEAPSLYEVALARSQRWARGDWQLLPWIMGLPPRVNKTRKSKSLPFISRWKMADNLRRSLSASALLLTFLLSWTIPSAPVAVWMIFILAIISIIALQPLLGTILPRGKRISIGQHLRALRVDFYSALSHVFLTIVFLAHEACVMSGAIARTLYRLFISHRNMLEWNRPQAKSNSNHQLTGFYKRMVDAPLISVTALLLICICGTTERFWMMAPFAILWILSPWIAQRISLPTHTLRSIKTLTPSDQHYLRQIARKTWLFFETFVDANHHFLPPDNFQEVPELMVAQRTSPTNIGLYLLSVTAAWDFGWIGMAETVERLEQTLTTVKGLNKYRGHLFNWYNTTDLKPLNPLYVSMVDSGNLAGHLWTIANTCRELAGAPVIRPDIRAGFHDVIPFILEAASHTTQTHRAETVTTSQLEEALSVLKTSLLTTPETASEWHDHLSTLTEQLFTLIDIAKAMQGSYADTPKSELLEWSELLLHQVQSHAKDFNEHLFEANPKPPAFLTRLSKLADLCEQLVQDMEFGFLFDPVKKIFSIGYQVAEKKLDAGYYDLLTSEARLGSFVAIAKNDVPSKHWFRLSRSLISIHHHLVLISWSGSMFEYLMPLLVMHSPLGSLLDQTCRGIVQRQIDYGTQRKVPWGISESAYNVQNLERNYQYSNFGVPGLGLKRGLAETLVVTPYATALAAMIRPREAVANFKHLETAGALGRFGFFEALDFTPDHLAKNETVAVVRAYMSHHQGMTLVSLANVLYAGVFQARFHQEPKVKASDLLLQERTPREAALVRVRPIQASRDVEQPVSPVLRRFNSPHEAVPRTHLLSNGNYHVMLTAAGSGYSHWRNIAVTRWREDATRDITGTYFFIRDVESEEVWSAGYQPSGTEPKYYEVDFAEDRAEFIRKDGTIETTLEVIVSPEDDAEIRRVTLKNTGVSTRVIDVTSYAEMVLAPQAADIAHPAFSNLFVHTEFVSEVKGLLCHRRPRFPDEQPVWAAQVLAVEGKMPEPIQYESNRSRFLGRGRGIRTPLSVIDGKPLSNNAGAVLDPIVSLRCRVSIPPGEIVRMTFTTLITASRKDAMELADKYHDPAMFERTLTQAWTHSHIQHHHLGMGPTEAYLYQDLASRILYANNGLRPSKDVLKHNTRGPSALWPYRISGDLPIVLVRLNDAYDSGIVHDILRANEYWHMKNLAIDLVILNEREPTYAEDLQSTLENLVRLTPQMTSAGNQKRQGGIFILREDMLSAEELIFLRTAARITLQSRYGSLSQQIERLEKPVDFAPPVRRKSKTTRISKALPEVPQLQFFNGLGGFSPDGREYVIHLGTGQWTPAPWINVIANPQFGFQISELGSGYTWAENSRENQITPWSNDPVSDTPSEIFYIRDEDTGQVWTPTALPIREEAWPYVVRHGQGYTQFEHISHEIRLELLQFVPVHDPIKISRLTITNESSRHRTLSVTAYVEWVLGVTRHQAAPFIITELDEHTGAVLARNPSNSEFAQCVAFADLVGEKNAWTTDRTEFLGRNGTYDLPAALFNNSPLSKKCGAGLDPCAALQHHVELQAGESLELVFLLGQGHTREASIELINHYRKTDLNKKLSEVKKQWNDICGAVQVRTPDPSMDLMLNRWLLYQTLVCRIWARSGFYQAGGAYGFRDQLQDVMALTVSRRDIARAHILRAAHHQFADGDVQHWWHPPSGRGVRTRISDDLVWLPYVVTHYLNITGDLNLLDETVPFLEGQPIPVGKEDAYFQPLISAENATLFEHCARALDRSLSVGSHGLPLIGTGDWNDGMNRVGPEGKGESIWLAWFLHTTLWEFAKVAEARGDAQRAEKWRLHVGDLKTAIEHHGWDGNWYRRAFFDDGTPLGSSANTECRIDAIAQSWGVLSGAADPARALKSMAALKEHLVRQKDKLVLLLTPPFDHMEPSPGYIRGYLPGVRENGGQYTHAAIWTLLAFAALGDGDTAGELFALLNPIHHAGTRADIQRYKVEPYVMAADVYAGPGHVGRGGWTWYTGSAAWMYRAGLEWILGFRLKENKLFMDPCIPSAWPEFELSFTHHAAHYTIKVENPRHVSRGIQSIELDGRSISRAEGIPLTQENAKHQIRIVLG